MSSSHTEFELVCQERLKKWKPDFGVENGRYNGRDDSLQWWHKRGSNKYPRLSVLAKEFLSICASSSPSERLFSTGRGIITYRRGRLPPDTISALMTLKSWRREDATRDDEMD